VKIGMIVKLDQGHSFRF